MQNFNNKIVLVKYVCGIAVSIAFSYLALHFKNCYLRSVTTDWSRIRGAYEYLLLLIAIGIPCLMLIPTINLSPNHVHKIIYKILIIGLISLYAWKYLHDLHCIPLSLAGENNLTSIFSAEIWGRLSHWNFRPPDRYDLGLAYMYIPVHLVIGSSVWGSKLVHFFCWTLSLAIVARVLWKEKGYEGLIALFLIVSTFSYGLAIERHCKWYAVLVMMFSAIFWLIYKIEHRGGIIYYILIPITITIATIMYRGCLIGVFIIPFYFLFTLWIHRETLSKHPLLPIIGSISSIIFAYYILSNYGTQIKEITLLKLVPIVTKDPSMQELNIALRRFLGDPISNTSKLNFIAFIFGLSAIINDFWKSWIARYASLWYILTIPMILFMDIGRANYLIIFKYITMAYGAYAVLIRLPTYWLRITAIIAFAIFATQSEHILYYTNYYQTPDPGDDCAQGVLALYDIKAQNEISKSIILFPSSKFAEAHGNFQWQLYTDVLSAWEYRYLKDQLVYFDSLNELRDKIDELLDSSTILKKRIVVYISPNIGKPVLEQNLSGFHYRIEEPVYFENYWHVKVPIYKVIL